MSAPGISVLVLADDGDETSVAVRATLASVREQTMRAVDTVVVTALGHVPAAARGRYLLALHAGETLERDACRNLWEAAERTGAGLVAGRWALLGRSGGEQPEQPWQSELFARSRVAGSLDEVPGLRTTEALLTGWCARRGLLENLPAGELTEEGASPGTVIAQQATRIALVPQLIVRRPAPAGTPRTPPAGADGHGNRLTYCETDPASTGLLVLAGRLPDPFPGAPGDVPRQAALELRARDRGTRVRLPLTQLRWNGAGSLHWRADIRFPRAFRPLGRGDTVWDLRLAVRAGADEALTEPAADLPSMSTGELLLPARPRLSRLAGDTWHPYVTLHGRLALRLESHTAAVCRVRGVLRRLRPSALRRRVKKWLRAKRDRLRSGEVKLRVYEGLLCRLPLRRGSVVFESHMGRQYGDSPRAIYEEARRRGLRLRCYWSYASSPEGFPEDARLVRRWSWSYLTALARAEYWVDNQGFPQKVGKPRRTTYIQTWHGSAYKRMGADEARVKMLNAAARRRLQQAVDRFDHFLVRGEHDVRTLGRAYRLPGEKLMRVGYPRNDRLAGGAAPDAELAAQLGLTDGRQVVLYAPTFRGDAGGKARKAQLLLDVERFAERFADEKVLLVRSHYLERVTLPGTVRGDVVDVSGRHDVTAVLGLADVLVTDYSSVMFDYVLLDRPMVFYTPDLREYTTQRGSYFDLREHAPGPLAETEDDLFRVLADIAPAPGSAPDDYAAARRRFAAEFGGYDTGGAAAAVVDRFFEGRHGG